MKFLVVLHDFSLISLSTIFTMILQFLIAVVASTGIISFYTGHQLILGNAIDSRRYDLVMKDCYALKSQLQKEQIAKWRKRRRLIQARQRQPNTRQRQPNTRKHSFNANVRIDANADVRNGKYSLSVNSHLASCFKSENWDKTTPRIWKVFHFFRQGIRRMK